MEIILDIINTKITQPTNKCSPITKNNEKILFHFNNPLFNIVKINNIIRNSDVKLSFPNIHTIEKYKTPMTIYKYNPPIRSKLFNYRQLALDNNNNIPSICSCHLSPYKDNYHNHIITGDLSIITDPKVRNLFKMGPKFRIPTYPYKDKFIDQVMIDILTYTNKIVVKHKLNPSIFNKWIDKIYELLMHKVNRCDIRNSAYLHNKYKLNKYQYNYIKQLQINFIITSVDKAQQNIAIICKRFYFEQLHKELTNHTYNLTPVSQEIIIDTHVNELDNLFQIKTIDKNKSLPFIHLIPKFHKNPIKFRPIIASSFSTTQSISKQLSNILKLITTKMEKYCNTIEKSTKLNSFWIIDNNKKILNTINRLSKCKKLKNISTFDFSTLYTTINHEELYNAMEQILNIAYHKSDTLKIIQSYTKTFWSYNPNYIGITQQLCLKMLKWLIDNTFFVFNNVVSREKLGSGPPPKSTTVHGTRPSLLQV